LLLRKLSRLAEGVMLQTNSLQCRAELVIAAGIEQAACFGMRDHKRAAND